MVTALMDGWLSRKAWMASVSRSLAYLSRAQNQDWRQSQSQSQNSELESDSAHRIGKVFAQSPFVIIYVMRRPPLAVQRCIVYLRHASSVIYML